MPWFSLPLRHAEGRLQGRNAAPVGSRDQRKWSVSFQVVFQRSASASVSKIKSLPSVAVSRHPAPPNRWFRQRRSPRRPPRSRRSPPRRGRHDLLRCGIETATPRPTARPLFTPRPSVNGWACSVGGRSIDRDSARPYTRLCDKEPRPVARLKKKPRSKETLSEDFDRIAKRVIQRDRNRTQRERARSDVQRQDVIRARPALTGGIGTGS